MSHSPHGPVLEIGLSEDCERCGEIADNPFANADELLLSDLMGRAVDRSRVCRSDAEALAVKRVLDALEHAGRLAQADPGQFFAYLEDRWHVSPPNGG